MRHDLEKVIKAIKESVPEALKEYDDLWDKFNEPAKSCAMDIVYYVGDESYEVKCRFYSIKSYFGELDSLRIDDLVSKVSDLHEETIKFIAEKYIDKGFIKANYSRRYHIQAIKNAIETFDSPSKLAKAIKVSYSAVVNWQNGKSAPSFENCLKIQKATNGQVKAVDIRPEIADLLKHA